MVGDDASSFIHPSPDVRPTCATLFGFHQIQQVSNAFHGLLFLADFSPGICPFVLQSYS